jgi:hypothetical protein
MDQGRRNWLQIGSGMFLGGLAGMFSGKGIDKAYGQSGTAQGKLGSDQIAFPNSPFNSGKPLGQMGLELPPEAINGPWRNLRAVQQKKVFDCHAHGYTPDQAPGPWATQVEEKKVRASTPWLDKTDVQLKTMDDHGIAQAAVTADFVPLEWYEKAKYDTHPDRFIRTAAKANEEIFKLTDRPPELIAGFLREQCKKGEHGGADSHGVDGCVRRRFARRHLALGRRYG